MRRKSVSFTLPRDEVADSQISVKNSVDVSLSNVKHSELRGESPNRETSETTLCYESVSPQGFTELVAVKESISTDAETQSHEKSIAEGAENVKSVSSFSEMSLDPRLERAIEHMGWVKPTSAQGAVIPVALEGHSILVCSPTGSGKTASYAVPIIQQLCHMRSTSCPSPRAVVLVPTRELVYQVLSVFRNLARFIDGFRISPLLTNRGASWTSKSKDALEKMEGSTFITSGFCRAADVFIGTPASVKALHDISSTNPLGLVQIVVVDEADLVLNYGYEKDTRSVLDGIPTSAQSILVSATLDIEGMNSLKEVIFRQPSVVKILVEKDTNGGSVNGASHHVAILESFMDRYLVTFAMLRLNILRGKVLIFVNSINSAFKLKLFLEQFKIKTAVLNSELPANSRIHCIQQFNAGLVDILIAADEVTSDCDSQEPHDGGKRREKLKRNRTDKDEEFGLSRGVDFQDVAAVLNFDMPPTVQSYIHRAGRTARNGKCGTVISLVFSEKGNSTILETSQTLGIQIGPLAFRMEQIEGFRYRVEDCLRSVTNLAVRGARLADVRREMINAEHLKGHFEENPEDLEALQHNMQLSKNVQKHLGHIPSYLMPPGLSESIPKAATQNVKRWKGKHRKGMPPMHGNTDPLKKFSISGSSRQRYQTKHGIRKPRKEPHRGPPLMKSRKRRS